MASKKAQNLFMKISLSPATALLKQFESKLSSKVSQLSLLALRSTIHTVKLQQTIEIMM